MRDGANSNENLFAVSSQKEMADGDLGDESWMERNRLVFAEPHQPVIAAIVLICLCVIGLCLWHCRQVQGRFIDIDNADSLTADFRVDINLADWGEMVALPGVGEKLAKAIVERRDEYGPFESLTSLKDISGIGDKKVKKLEPFLLPLTPDNH